MKQKVKFIPLNPIEELPELEEEDENNPVKKIEKVGLEGYFEFWGMQSRAQTILIGNNEVPVYVVNIYGLTRDMKGNVYYCDPENIKFMND